MSPEEEPPNERNETHGTGLRRGQGLTEGSAAAEGNTDQLGETRLLKASGRRWLMLWFYLAILTVAFGGELWRLGILAWSSELYSHALLIPFVTGYLIWLRKREWPPALHPAPLLGAAIALMAVLALGGFWWLRRQGVDLSIPDRLSLTISGYLGFLIAGVAGIMGSRWLMAILFPLCSLLFMVPLPDHVVVLLETGSQLTSAEVANAFFALSELAYVREGNVFHLPGISLQVAQECSGIRSSLVLLITGAYAANLLLRTTWRRWFLVLFVIPLGVVRNGFRILTIGMLCVHVGPHMVDHAIHHRGGPVFFVLSLFPLLAVVWWLRRGENRESQTAGVPPETSGASGGCQPRRST